MESSKEKKVHNIFEKISNSYDHMNSVISFQQHIRWRKDIMNKMKVKKGTSALDVCCGTADWTIALAKDVGEKGKVIGLDFSNNMLKVGQQKLANLQINNAELVQGNAMELPFKDNSFDYATIGFGLRNVPDYLTVLQEMHRVLKPGGMAVCLDTSQPTMPGFRQFYFVYFRYIMPFFGKLLAKSYQEYRYLHDSARDFPGMEELKQLFSKAGYKDVTYKAYFGGVAAAHFAYKK